MAHGAVRSTIPGYSSLAQADGQKRQFTSKERDIETGLDFFEARYFSSVQGRFGSPDPIFISEQQIISPQIWNRYNYTGNQPLSYVDPDGLYRWATSLGGRLTDDDLLRKPSSSFRFFQHRIQKTEANSCSCAVIA
jgi:RHS repeat-associated protein